MQPGIEYSALYKPASQLGSEDALAPNLPLGPTFPHTRPPPPLIPTMPHTKDVLAHPPDPRPQQAHPRHRAERKHLEKHHSAFGWKELAALGVMGLIFSMNIEKEAEKRSKRNKERERERERAARDGEQQQKHGRDRRDDGERDRAAAGGPPRRSWERGGHPDGREPPRRSSGRYVHDARYDAYHRDDGGYYPAPGPGKLRRRNSWGEPGEEDDGGHGDMGHGFHGYDDDDD